MLTLYTFSQPLNEVFTDFAQHICSNTLFLFIAEFLYKMLFFTAQ